LRPKLQTIVNAGESGTLGLTGSGCGVALEATGLASRLGGRRGKNAEGEARGKRGRKAASISG